MSNALNTLFSNIAAAIRTKNGSSNTYYPNQMANAILAIPTGGSTINNQDKTVTPTSSQQLVSYDSGYTGLGTVTVYPIPSQYIVPEGTLQVTTNGVKDVTNYASINVNVPTGSTINNQDKSINPTESVQTITADSGYTGLGEVTIGAISSAYVGSGITRRDSDDLSASGATITAPAGYYSAAASKSVTTMTLPTSAASSATSGYTSKATISRSTSAQYINIPPGYNSAGGYYVINAVANGTASAPSTISGTSATVSTGTNTLTLTKTVSVTPVVSVGYVSSGTATNSSVSLTASVTTKAAATITPGTSNQTIAAGTYLTGAQTISGDANLVGSNILSNVSIFGVNGTVDFITCYTGSSAPSSSTGSNGDIYLQT